MYVGQFSELCSRIKRACLDEQKDGENYRDSVMMWCHVTCHKLTPDTRHSPGSELESGSGGTQTMKGELRLRDSTLTRTVTAGGSKGAGREDTGEPGDRGQGGSSTLVSPISRRERLPVVLRKIKPRFHDRRRCISIIIYARHIL